MTGAIIMRGLPGAGKSRYVNNLALMLTTPFAVVSSTYYEGKVDAIDRCFQDYVSLLGFGRTIIVDDINADPGVVDKYVLAAQDRNVPPVIVEIVIDPSVAFYRQQKYDENSFYELVKLMRRQITSTTNVRFVNGNPSISPSFVSVM